MILKNAVQHGDTFYVGVKETNQLIRAALKRAFPSIKFTVRSYGGRSTRVGWVDGPTVDQVEAITEQYGSARFDGSVDYAYSVNHWLLPDGSTIIEHSEGSQCTGGYSPAVRNEQPMPEAIKVHFMLDYVFAERSKSVEFLKAVLNTVKDYWGVKEEIPVETYNDGSAHIAKDFYVPNAGEWLATLVHRSSVKLAW